MSFLLNGKVAIITGANQGLGLAISHKYVNAGASLVMCARNNDLLTRAKRELSAELAPGQVIEVIPADVSDIKSVEQLLKATMQRFGRIDILVNNAGVYGAMGPIEEVDWAQWIRAIEINLFGSILMCRAVLPTMKEQKKGKIIQLSGGGATNPMPNISAYAASKAAIVRFSETLAEEVRDFSIDVNAIAPGALNSRMLDEVLAAGPDKVGQAFFDKAVQQKESGGTGFDRGAELAVFLASDASNGITGKLISAVWDKWENWPEHKDELYKSDIYTLRRIAGRDRGVSWGDK
ncbi:MAG: SDR family oxidoreductase [Desulfobacterium sp.]|nr:SDR family oxidoreductase [Desulfobacterium sp.]MBU3948483.1 SDR family oxidoreductase [Pseudomonadota bacterium]